MKHFIPLLLFAGTLTLTTSCTSRHNTIDDLSELVDDMDKNGESYTQKDWDSAEKQLKEISEELAGNSADYTDEEKRELAKLATRAAMLMAKQHIKDAVPLMQGVMEGISENQDVINEAVDAYGEMLEDVVKGISDDE